MKAYVLLDGTLPHAVQRQAITVGDCALALGMRRGAVRSQCQQVSPRRLAPHPGYSLITRETMTCAYIQGRTGHRSRAPLRSPPKD